MEPIAGPSVWERAAFHRAADLAIVGGGIVGLFAALFHQRRFPRHRVVVLERGAFPSGASARNAGFACFGSPSELLADMDREGADAALARVEERWRGLRELRAELSDAAIGFEPCGGYELYREGDGLHARVADRFEALNDALRPILGPGAFRWDGGAPERFGLRGVRHAAFTPLEGALDSGLLLRALMSKAAGAGAELRFGARVTALEEDAHGVALRLAGGGSMRAERVLVATNGYTPALLPRLDVLPARGQVLLTAPVPGLRLHGTFHMEEGFYYFRHCQGGVLLGGGR
ncbi:MAG: NAD(P)/FAD-dependent oxidoreductase, partial [Flavobacteriales bacterium]